ncbi:MAG: isoaspartyl peptidase/L-asparaginase [Bifidobacterium dentium]
MGEAWHHPLSPDSSGNIAAGTSTGGITNQMRVGDSPLPGCGT